MMTLLMNPRYPIRMRLKVCSILWIFMAAGTWASATPTTTAVPSGLAAALSSLVAEASMSGASTRTLSLTSPTSGGEDPLGSKVKDILAQPTVSPSAGNNGEEEDVEVETVYTTTIVPCPPTVAPSTSMALARREEIVSDISEVQTVVNQVIEQRIQQATQQQQVNSFTSYAQELFQKRHEMHLREVTESKQIITEAINTLMTSDFFKELRESHQSEAMQWLQSNTYLNQMVQQVMSEKRFEQRMQESWKEIKQSSKEVWSRIQQYMQQQQVVEQQTVQQQQVVQQQTVQQEQTVQQQLQQQQQQNLTTQNWASQHGDCLQAIISTLSSTEQASSCKALKIQRRQHYQVKDAIQALLVPPANITSPLQYQVAVQNVFNDMYQQICFREHYAEYERELAAWYRDEGWVRRAPPIPPSKMCPPARLFAFSRQAPPWLNRMPAWIRAQYYGDSSMLDGQVHLAAGAGTDAKLYKLRRQGRLSASEYAYLKSLKRANDRLLLTGPSGPSAGAILPRLVKLLAGWNVPKETRPRPAARQPLNVLLPRSGLAAVLL